MIGWPHNDNATDVSDSLGASVVDYTTVCKWDTALGWQYEYKDNPGLNNFDLFEPDKGYWIYVEDAIPMAWNA